MVSTLASPVLDFDPRSTVDLRKPSFSEGSASARRLPLSEEEFAAAIEPHLRVMHAAASNILHCEHHAWDAVQETLLSLWCEQELPANMRAWLLRAVTYRSLQLRRSCKRRRERETKVACCRCECSCAGDPTRVLAEGELRRIFHDACGRLPKALREVFVMRAIDRLDYESIARRLQIPVGTVRSRLNRARQTLQEIFAFDGTLAASSALSS
jgi:RNA polymerase sigma-70 factor, ECF subfamily